MRKTVTEPISAKIAAILLRIDEYNDRREHWRKLGDTAKVDLCTAVLARMAIQVSAEFDDE
jgi:hypothetical protein